MKQTQFECGTFFIGCNYWASHAGMRMWSDWQPDVVEDDLKRLAENRVLTLRVFPLWSDFQPLRMLYAGGGAPREIRLREEPLGFDELGRAGIDPVMMDRFRWFCDTAQSFGIRLIVGLLTGWMSGRLFVPEMLQGRNVYTDPLALQWEIRFVRAFVHHFAGHEAIAAWDLGNECNCMGRAEDAPTAYAWTAAISMAIRVEDGAHPIVSGMHGLSPQGVWRMQDQGELLDVLCTHPYPIFTPHCDTDPLNGMKSPLHAPAESLYYAGIGRKQCFAEETGTLGPMMVSDEIGADYLRMTLFGLMSHDCRGLMWWCGFEQKALEFPPYDWNGVERELGLFYLDKTPKPVLHELRRFSEYVEALPFDTLPPEVSEAVCILTRGQDSWAVAYGTFILAVQAGISLRFAWADAEIPEGQAYLMPCLMGDASISRHAMADILRRVRDGATLYLSMDGPLLSPFTEFSGLRVLTRAHAPQETDVVMDGVTMKLRREFRLHFEPVGASVLARTSDGDVALAVNTYGRGKVYTCAFPVELTMATQPGVVDDVDGHPCCMIYRRMRLEADQRVVAADEPRLGLSEHIFADGSHAAVLINYRPETVSAPIRLKDGWSICEQFPYVSGDGVDGNSVVLSKNSALIIRIRRDG